MLDLVASGKAYVKLSAPHRITADPDDAGPIARALIAANAARVLWGSDWPHTGPRHSLADAAAVEPFQPIDDGLALKRLRLWAGDIATLDKILVSNPARLYGFTTG